jgi:phage terminase large subunit-like protein
MGKPKRSLTRGEQNVAWIETFCRVPEGKHVGEAIRLRGFQRDIVRGIYDTPTRSAIISFGRKNSKTALAAMLALLHLCGPEARINSQLFSAAQSREQASILFTLMVKMVRQSPDLSAYVTVRDTKKELYCHELGTTYRALSADASTAYGLSPVFVVHDELGQVKGPRSELYEALETACAAQEAPLSIVISTQAPTDADLLSVLIDDAATGTDERVKLFLHTAPTDLDPFSEEAVRAANPAFDEFMNKVEVMALAENARRMPSREADYRNLVLNQRVSRRNLFVSANVWKSNGKPPFEIEDFGEMPVYCGLDLSATRDLTALVMVIPDGDTMHVISRFWLPSEGIRERSHEDRVEYDRWAEEGFLQLSPGASVQYEFVAWELRDLFDTLNIQAVAFDRYNMRFLKPWLEKAGFSEAELERFKEFGQGLVSMSPALRSLESLLLDAKLRHGMHPVLTMCASNAVVFSDAAGNRKFAKDKANGRIDGMVSLAMAVAMATGEGPVRVPEYQMFFI